MDKKTRKELQEEYKQIKTYMGVIRLTNKVNGKIFIAAYVTLQYARTQVRGYAETYKNVLKSGS